MKPVRAAVGVVAVCALICGLIDTATTKLAVAQPPAAARALDFLVENVCVDDGGKVLIGVSPIDGDPRCVSQRDLRPGEPLAYHERNWPAEGVGENRRGLRGSDSFPVATRAMGNIAIHVYDAEGGLLGVAFDEYDPATQAGGGTIAALSADTISFVATQLGHQNLKLFIGKGCEPGQPVTAAALQDAWVLAPIDQLASVEFPAAMPGPSNPIAGGIVSLPAGIVDAGDGAICPLRRHYGTTRWSLRPVTYRAVYKSGPDKGGHVRLWTLVAERFGRGADYLDRALHFERAYFTRELGWTRWEAWISANASYRGASRWASDLSGGVNQRVLQAHDRIVGRGNCGLPDGTAPDSGFGMPAAPADSHGVPRADLVIVGCIDVTDIVPPFSRSGDPAPIGPGSWYYSVVNNPVSAASALFAP
jgi:hypothetical protein